MGLFGKKEDAYTIFLSFDGAVSLEDELLVAMFDACKRHGLSLVAEPTFADVQGQTMVNFAFANGVFGGLSWFYLENQALINLYRPVASSFTDEALANTVRDWFDTMNGMQISFSFNAQKAGTFRNEEWDALKPTRRSYM